MWGDGWMDGGGGLYIFFWTFVLLMNFFDELEQINNETMKQIELF